MHAGNDKQKAQDAQFPGIFELRTSFQKQCPKLLMFLSEKETFDRLNRSAIFCDNAFSFCKTNTDQMALHHFGVCV